MSQKSNTHPYSLHVLVWHNEYENLKKALEKKEFDIEAVDVRGRTPLHLAVSLAHLESARVLLQNGASASAENSKYWTVLQEAVSTGDPELVQLCLQYRDYERNNQRTDGVPALLQKLTQTPDFYVEMKWEFTSWVPLVSRMCPSDTYKVWKSGANVRIDTTLLGFDNMNWQRGSRSFIFQGSVDSASIVEVDHDVKQVWSEQVHMEPAAAMDLANLLPSDDAVASRLTTPLVTTYIDTDKVAFQRNKAGIWGWRSDKVETVNDYECKVFSASNVELMTKTRTEHLTEQDKHKLKKNGRHPLETLLKTVEQEEKLQGATANGMITSDCYNPGHITEEEYFDPDVDLEGRDIGRPIEQTCKRQTFKANLWLCEDFPLSLPEQVLPIIDLMAASNAHFRKLREFITLQLPAGFPIKIEIPLFHMLNARITFGNIFATETPMESVNCTQLPGLKCTVDPSCFTPPSDYSVLGDGPQPRIRDEYDELLQFAIQESLLESGTETDQVTMWQALNLSNQERVLQQVLEESMMNSYVSASTPVAPPDDTNSQVNESDNTALLDDDDEQLRAVLEMSERQAREAEAARKEEELQLQQILELSLTDK